MVQGLAFLSKKSWHTKNKANQERVWVAEQQKEAEAAKTRELARQIQQEREWEELDKITGRTSVVKDRGIDWMYQGATNHGEVARQDAERRAEEYLLGKEFVGEGGVRGDFDDGNQKDGIHNVLSSNPAAASRAETAPPPPALLRREQGPQYEDGTSTWGPDAMASEPSVHDRNESFRLRVEDPMYMVSQKRREKESKIEKAKALYERVVGTVDDTANDTVAAAAGFSSRRDGHSDINRNGEDDSLGHDSRKRKRSKKDRKRRERGKRPPPSPPSSRHRERHRSERGSDSDSDLYHDKRRRRRSRSRSRSNERDRKRRRSRYRDESSGGSKSSDNSYEKSRHDSYHVGGSRRFDEERSHGRYRRQHNDRDRVDRHYAGHTRREREESSFERQNSGCGYNGDSHVSRDMSKPSPGRPRSTQGDLKRSEGYGLQGAHAPPVVHGLDLGPNKELLQRKREERDNERRRIHETASTRRRSTEKEREQALYEMKEDARKRERRIGRHASHRQTDEGKAGPPTSERNPSFLNDITKQTHGICSQSSSSLAARVAQNRHTNQRLDDSFL